MLPLTDVIPADSKALATFEGFAAASVIYYKLAFGAKGASNPLAAGINRVCVRFEPCTAGAVY